MSRNNIVLIAIAFLLLSSCKKESRWDCFKSTGDIITEDRSIGSFSNIDLEDGINIIITQDSVCSLKIEGGKNLLSNVSTEVDGNTLYISNKNKCNWVRSFKKEITAHLSVKELNHIEYKGFGDITSTNHLAGQNLKLDVRGATGSVNLKLNVEEVHATIHIGAADITFSGNAQKSYSYCGDIGHIDFRNLESPYAEASNIGTGNIYVYASEQLYATTEYIGPIYYSGNPVFIYPNQLGEGEIKPL